MFSFFFFYLILRWNKFLNIEKKLECLKIVLYDRCKNDENLKINITHQKTFSHSKKKLCTTHYAQTLMKNGIFKLG